MVENIKLSPNNYILRLESLLLELIRIDEKYGLPPHVFYMTEQTGLDEYALNGALNFFLDCEISGDCENPDCQSGCVKAQDNNTELWTKRIKETCSSPFVYGYVFGAVGTAELSEGGEPARIFLMLYEGEFEPVALARVLESDGTTKPLEPLVGEERIRSTGSLVSTFLGTYERKELVAH